MLFLKAGFFILVFFGLFLFVFGLYFPFDAWAAKDWTPVEGEVVSVRIRSQKGVNDNVYKKGPYAPNVRYRWIVDGVEHEGTIYRLGHGSDAGASWRNYPTRQEASDAAVAAGYRKGAPIQVFYDPREPSRAVLDPRPSLAVWVPLVIGSLFLMVAWGLFRQREAIFQNVEAAS